MIPATGSTTPDKAPYKNDFPLLFPSLLSGIEMMAPSGKFWIAIPRDRAKAPATESVVLPAAAPAKTTPTAIPSGILCKVTAKTSIAVFFKRERGPSGTSVSKCR